MPDEIKNVDVSSHKLPLYLLSDYLKNETGAEIIIIGIEPELLCKGNFLSKAVESAVNEISDWFSEFFKKSFQV
jgi:Ni,Fe-hydrogenase maturation factor